MSEFMTVKPADARLTEFESKPPTRLERAVMWLTSHLLPVPETVADAEVAGRVQAVDSVVPMHEASEDTLRAIAVMQTERSFINLP